jgi:transcriptional regulator GlxA family with amidase domain
MGIIQESSGRKASCRLGLHSLSETLFAGRKKGFAQKKRIKFMAVYMLGGARMKIAFVLYDGMTLLDFIGVYDPITRLKTMNYLDLHWDLVAYTGTVKDTTGITISIDKTRVGLESYDIIFIPGGFGSRAMIKNHDFLDWLRTGKDVSLKVSVCTGSLLLGAAGFLTGKKATSRTDALKDLERYTSRAVKERIVEDDGIITSMGCSSSLDLGLYLCHKLAGKSAAESIQKQIEYLCTI